MCKLKFFPSFLFLVLFSSTMLAQEGFKPSALRLGLDLTGVGYTLFNSGYNHAEINGDLQIKKVFFAFDVGRVERTYEKEFRYRYSGSFFRAGLDVNLIPQDPDQNVIFFGVRYARAFYNDEISYLSGNDSFGYQEYEYENPQVNGRWMEAVGGMKVRVWNNIFLGYTVRLKFAQKTSGAANFSTYEIPGFGKAAKSGSFGVNYHIFYRIPFRRG